MKSYLLSILAVGLTLGTLQYCSGASFSHCKKTIKVAVIDTGLNLRDPRFKRDLCKTGHRNFTQNESIADTNGHGTFMAALIQQYSGRGNYCILIEKYYSSKQTESDTIKAMAAAIKSAIQQGATIVNISGGGGGYNQDEHDLIVNNPDVTFIVAAGNESHDLDIPGNEYYPASYYLDNEQIVGAVDSEGTRPNFSNYGSHVIAVELGVDVPFPYIINGEISHVSGTSPATAIHTGKEVAKRLDTCYND